VAEVDDNPPHRTTLHSILPHLTISVLTRGLKKASWYQLLDALLLHFPQRCQHNYLAFFFRHKQVIQNTHMMMVNKNGIAPLPFVRKKPRMPIINTG